MSCRHGWYGYGPWHGPAACDDWYGPPGWYGPPAWYEEGDVPWRAGRRGPRTRRQDQEATARELEAALEELRAEIGRVEAELSELRASGEGSATP
jgi:hypothetical protein